MTPMNKRSSRRASGSLFKLLVRNQPWFTTDHY
jgi:hypothetical protein